MKKVALVVLFLFVICLLASCVNGCLGSRCPGCNGSGRIEDPKYGYTTSCPVCDGTGKV